MTWSKANILSISPLFFLEGFVHDKTKNGKFGTRFWSFCFSHSLWIFMNFSINSKVWTGQLESTWLPLFFWLLKQRSPVNLGAKNRNFQRDQAPEQTRKKAIIFQPRGNPGNLRYGFLQSGSILTNPHLGGGFKYFIFSSLPAEMIQVDEHIFQMGGSTTT